MSDPVPTDDQVNVRFILSQSGRNEGVFSVADRIIGLFSERLVESDAQASVIADLAASNPWMNKTLSKGLGCLHCDGSSFRAVADVDIHSESCVWRRAVELMEAGKP